MTVGQESNMEATPGARATPTIPVDYERFLDCVHCGLCLDACPTYVELGVEPDSPRGRIHLMRAVADGRISMDSMVARHLDLCLGCRACETACPSGVRYGSLIEAARSTVEKWHRRPLAERLLRRLVIGSLLPYPRRLALALAPVRLLDLLGLRPVAVRFLPRTLGRLLRLLPAPRPRARLRRITPAATQPRAGTVGLLRGCVMPVLYPDVAAATARVLAALGYEVEAPASGCCGALHLHAGDRDRALAGARRTVDVFTAGGRDARLGAVVTNAAGCGAMMREYGELLAGEPKYAARAAALAARVRDVSEVIDAAAGRLELGPLPFMATYHDACHLAHGQGVRAAPRRLLARIPGLRLEPLAESDVCCGSAGTYNMTEPEMAERLLKRKIECILATGAPVVVMGNPGCMLQIAAGLADRGAPVEVLHTVEIIDRALVAGRSGP